MKAPCLADRHRKLICGRDFCRLRGVEVRRFIIVFHEISYKLENELRKLETKNITSLKGNAIPAGYSHTHMPITGVELNNISIVTVRSIWHNSAADLLRCGKFTPHICVSCGVTYRPNYETFSAL